MAQTNAKSEKEKMITGELYFAGGPELTEERNRAHALCFKFNKLKADDYEACSPEALVWSRDPTSYSFRDG